MNIRIAKNENDSISASYIYAMSWKAGYKGIFSDKLLSWGKGYSKKLMDFMISRLKEKGYTKAHLWVLKDNIRAQRFYEKCGFEKTGKEIFATFKGETKLDIEYAHAIQI